MEILTKLLAHIIENYPSDLANCVTLLDEQDDTCPKGVLRFLLLPLSGLTNKEMTAKEKEIGFAAIA